MKQPYQVLIRHYYCPECNIDKYTMRRELLCSFKDGGWRYNCPICNYEINADMIEIDEEEKEVF